LAVFALSFSLLVTAARLGDDSKSAFDKLSSIVKEIPGTVRESTKELQRGIEHTLSQETNPETHIVRAENAAEATVKTIKKETEPQTHINRAKKILGF
jgi:hypothetical protein